MSSFSCDWRSSGVLSGSAIASFSEPALAAFAAFSAGRLRARPASRLGTCLRAAPSQWTVSRLRLGDARRLHARLPVGLRPGRGTEALAAAAHADFAFTCFAAAARTGLGFTTDAALRPWHAVGALQAEAFWPACLPSWSGARLGGGWKRAELYTAPKPDGYLGCPGARSALGAYKS
jgi:hypothetical protein